MKKSEEDRQKEKEQQKLKDAIKKRKEEERRVLEAKKAEEIAESQENEESLDLEFVGERHNFFYNSRKLSEIQRIRWLLAQDNVSSNLRASSNDATKFSWSFSVTKSIEPVSRCKPSTVS